MPPDMPAPTGHPVVRLGAGERVALIVIACSALFSMLYVARFLFLPIVLAGLVAITFAPLVRRMARIGLPEPLTALLIVLGLVLGLVGAVAGLSQPVAAWIEQAPQIADELRTRLSGLQYPIAVMNRAIEEVARLANPEAPAADVSIQQPSLLWRAAGGSLAVAGAAVVTVALSLFLLSYAEIFQEKTLRIMPRFGDKKRAYTILREIERNVSRYLLIVTAINILLGVAIGLAMHLLGMPSPILWGIGAAALNFMPYVGAVIGFCLVTAVSIVTFDTIAAAALPPLAYLVISVLEGQFLTPAAIGHRLQLNPAVILIAIALWGFLWGFLGVLVTVPLLILAKVLCDNIDSLNPIGEFIGARSRS